MLKTVSIIVAGKVQGVYYRQSTRETARDLAINGWVRNMPDDTVSIMATGNEDRIEQFIAWCKQGPKRSVVTNIIISELPVELFEQFSILR